MAIEIAVALKEAGVVAKDVVQKTGEAAIEKGKQVSEKIKGMSETDITETAEKTLEDIKNAGDGVLNKLEDIKKYMGSSLHGAAETNLISIHEDSGLIPGLTQQLKDPALPQARV